MKQSIADYLKRHGWIDRGYGVDRYRRWVHLWSKVGYEDHGHREISQTDAVSWQRQQLRKAREVRSAARQEIPRQEVLFANHE